MIGYHFITTSVRRRGRDIGNGTQALTATSTTDAKSRVAGTARENPISSEEVTSPTEPCHGATRRQNYIQCGLQNTLKTSSCDLSVSIVPCQRPSDIPLCTPLSTIPTSLSKMPPSLSTIPISLSTMPTSLSTMPTSLPTMPTSLSTTPTSLSTSSTSLSTMPTSLSTTPTCLSTSPTSPSTLPTSLSTSPPSPSALPTSMSTTPTSMSTTPTALSTMPLSLTTMPTSLSTSLSTMPPSLSTMSTSLSTMSTSLSTMSTSLSTMSTTLSPMPAGHHHQQIPRSVYKLGPDESYDLVAKVILLGDSHVGKTLFLRSLSRLTDEHGAGRCDETREREMAQVVFSKNGRRIALRITDTGGQEKYRSITSSYYRGVHGCLLLFHVSSEDTFSNIMSWYEELHHFSTDEFICAILVGTTSAGRSRVVSPERGLKLADNLGIPYMECCLDHRVMSSEIVQRLMEIIMKVGLRWTSVAISIKPENRTKRQRQLRSNETCMCF